MFEDGNFAGSHGFIEQENTPLPIVQERMRLFTRQWIKLKRSIRALSEGTTVDFHYDENSYVFGRVFEQASALRNSRNSYAVVAFNTSDKMKVVTLRNHAIGDSTYLAAVLSDQNRHRTYPRHPDAKAALNEKQERVLSLPA